MKTTHTSMSNSPSRRFFRRNLPPNHAAALVVLDSDMDILAVVSAAARFTSDPGSPEQFDQLFVAQHGDDADVPAKCSSVPVDADQHRTTIMFQENGFTKRIGQLAEGRCWAAILIRGKAPDALRPEIIWQPLDERSWLPTREMESKFPLPALGESWPMANQLREYADINPEVWHLLVTSAVVIGGLPPMAFPEIKAPMPPEMNFLKQRDAKIRAERSVERTKRMLERLPAEMRDAFLARLAGSASRVAQ